MIHNGILFNSDHHAEAVTILVVFAFLLYGVLQSTNVFRIYRIEILTTYYTHN